MWVWKYSFRDMEVMRSMRVPAQSMPTWRVGIVSTYVGMGGGSDKRTP